MKTIICLLVVFSVTPTFADQVRGHTTKTGKVVAPYNRTTPNKTVKDNYSTKGNVNPYTGKAGTKPSNPKPPKKNKS